MAGRKEELFKELRAKAEKLLKKSEVKDLFSDIEDMEKLVEELHIYQIELEMQQQELQETNATLSRERLRYRDLYMKAPVAYFTLNETGNILELNNAAAEMLDKSLQSFKNTSIFPYLEETSRLEFNRYFKRVFNSDNVEYGELFFVNSRQQLVPVRLWASSYFDPEWNKQVVRCAVTDQSTLKEYEREVELQKQIANAIAKYETIFSVTSVGIGIVDEDCMLVESNEAFTKMLGYSREEMYGRSVRDFTHPEDVEKEGQIIQALTKEKPWARFEKRFLKKDGSIMWADMTASAVFQQDLPLYYVGVITDITEQVSSRVTIEKINSHLESALRSGNMAWWELELPSGNITFNERKATMLGYPPEKFKHYNDFMDLVHPDDYEPTMEAFRRHMRGAAESYSCEYRIRTIKGDYLWFRDHGKITSSKDGSTVLTGIVAEVTEYRRAKEELEAANNRFITILQHIKVGILVIQRDTQQILYANPYMENLFPNQLENHSCFEIFSYSEDKCSNCPVMADSEGSKLKDKIFTPHEYYVPELKMWFLRQISRIVWVDKQDAALMILTDITPIKEVEQLKEDISRIASHDLKNPLNGVLGGVQLLLLEADQNLNDEQIEYVRMIETSGKRMLTMIDESLGLYKMEAGLYELDPAEVNLEQLLKNIIEELKFVTAEHTIELEVQTGVPAAGEEPLCYSLFSNLIKNALEASKQNDVIKISVYQDEDSKITASIWNRAAIPEDIVQNFGTKYTTSGKPKGTGLGVYSARMMTETQGGIFQWESSEESGTTIKVSLPAAEK